MAPNGKAPPPFLGPWPTRAALYLKRAGNHLHLSRQNSAHNPAPWADWPFSNSCLPLADFGIAAQLLKSALAESPPSAFYV